MLADRTGSWPSPSDALAQPVRRARRVVPACIASDPSWPCRSATVSRESPPRRARRGRAARPRRRRRAARAGMPSCRRCARRDRTSPAAAAAAAARASDAARLDVASLGSRGRGRVGTATGHPQRSWTGPPVAAGADSPRHRALRGGLLAVDRLGERAAVDSARALSRSIAGSITAPPMRRLARRRRRLVRSEPREQLVRRPAAGSRSRSALPLPGRSARRRTARRTRSRSRSRSRPGESSGSRLVIRAAVQIVPGAGLHAALERREACSTSRSPAR